MDDDLKPTSSLNQNAQQQTVAVQRLLRPC